MDERQNLLLVLQSKDNEIRELKEQLNEVQRLAKAVQAENEKLKIQLTEKQEQEKDKNQLEIYSVEQTKIEHSTKLLKWRN